MTSEMLKPGEEFISILSDKVNFNRIELVNRAVKTKVSKVNPDLLKQLADGDSVDLLICPPSTSTAASVTPETSAPASPAPSVAASLRKRKIEEEEARFRAASNEKCTHCGCGLLRVVDPGRPDEERILECARASCLASVKFTDLPVGTVLGKEPNAKPFPIYNQLAEIYPDEDDSDDEETEQPRIFEMRNHAIYVSVPGQEGKARIQG